MKLKNFIKILTASSLALFITGCAGTSYTKVGTTPNGERTIITKKDIHVKTSMSETIFLEPVAPEEQIIFIKFRNTSDEQLNLTSKLKQGFKDIGFIITNNPKKANFMIQANLLRVGKLDLNEQKSYLGAGFGGAIIGGAVGSLASGGDGSDTRKAALAGAVINMINESLKVKNTYYAMVTDVEIRQRASMGESIIEEEELSNKIGSSGYSNQKVINKNTTWKKYRTRIISSAYAPGLEFIQAKPFLEDGLVRSLKGTM